MPRSPDMASTGSPGSRRISENTSSVMPMKVGSTSDRRLARKVNMEECVQAGRRLKPLSDLCFMGASTGLLGQVDLGEVVVRGRVHLVADHFLAHRIEAH